MKHVYKEDPIKKHVSTVDQSKKQWVSDGFHTVLLTSVLNLVSRQETFGDKNTARYELSHNQEVWRGQRSETEPQSDAEGRPIKTSAHLFRRSLQAAVWLTVLMWLAQSWTNTSTPHIHTHKHKQGKSKEQSQKTNRTADKLIFLKQWVPVNSDCSCPEGENETFLVCLKQDLEVKTSNTSWRKTTST